MQTPEPQIRVDETDAKAGSNSGTLRWILLSSLVLAIIAMSAIWITGALSQDDVESEGTATGREEVVAEQQGDGSDSSIDGVTAPAQQ